MPRQETFKVTQDIDGETLEGEILAESIDVWERNGWTVVEDGDSESNSETVAVEPGTQSALDSYVIDDEVTQPELATDTEE